MIRSRRSGNVWISSLFLRSTHRVLWRGTCAQWGWPSASDPRAKNTGQRATKGTVLTSQSLSPWCDCRRLGSALASWRWQDINVGNQLGRRALRQYCARNSKAYICEYIMRHACHMLDPFQYGAIRGCWTVEALVRLYHNWTEATGNTDSMIRVLFLDYRKAFHHIGHNILLRKMAEPELPHFVVRWITSFLHERLQRVRIGTRNSGLVTSLGRGRTGHQDQTSRLHLFD